MLDFVGFATINIADLQSCALKDSVTYQFYRVLGRRVFCYQTQNSYDMDTFL